MSNNNHKWQAEEKESYDRKSFDIDSPNFTEPVQEDISNRQRSVQKYGLEKLGVQQRHEAAKNRSEENDKNWHKYSGEHDYRQQQNLKNSGPSRFVMKIDGKDDLLQIQKQADQIFEQYTHTREKDLKRKKGQNQKIKNNRPENRVFTPEELKYYLEEDIKYETQVIKNQNIEQKTFFEELINKISSKINGELGVRVEIFGSFATGLCLPESDIDVVIIPREGKQDDSPITLLENIQKLLNKMIEEVQLVKFIKTASVPILKIQCTKKYYEKKIDITYQDEKHNGLKSVALIKQYLEIYPQLKQVTLILKKFIYSARLFDPYSGGISSYGLILMIVAFIQNQNREKKMKNSKNQAEPTVAELLIGFLQFYGFKNNYIAKQICVLEPLRARQEIESKYFDIHRDPIYPPLMDMDIIYNNDWQQQPRPKLVIMDPLNTNNNVGRATHKIRQIRAAFQMACVCIHLNHQCGRKRRCESYRRIKQLRDVPVRFEGNKRPCCIIKRMLESTSFIS